MNRTYRNLLSSLAAASALVAGGASAATTIETFSSWDGVSEIRFWGPPATQVYGQSITAPAGTSTLTGFSFSILDTAFPIRFSANVYEWTGSRITGPALFSLGDQIVGGGSSPAFLPVSFSTSVAVTPGTQYMLFLSTIDVPRVLPLSDTKWGGIQADVYAGGRFFFFHNNPSQQALFDVDWRSFFMNDTAFSATFDGTTVVPVPGALGLMLSGVAALGFLGRRRHKA